MNTTTFTNTFFAKTKSVTRSDRAYVLGNQVVQVLEFQDNNDKNGIAVHVLTFNADLEVTHSEWFSK